MVRRGSCYGVAACVCALVYVVNPAYLVGCGGSADSGEEDFAFGESELVRAGTGTWSGTATINGQVQAFTLTLEQASDAQGQALRTVGQGLCGSRSFVRPAAACIAVSTLPVVGTLTLGQEQEAVRGALRVYGATFEQGELSIRRPGEVSMSIQLDPQGRPLGEGAVSGEGLSGTWTMQRAAR